MRLSEIYAYLDALSPFSSQASWDNSGLLVGTMSDEIESIYVSLDCDSSLVDSLAEHSLLITHHPLIFSGLKQLRFDKYPSNILQKLISKKISLIAMHTNFDLSHLNAYVANQLGLKIQETKEYVAYCDINEPFDAFVSGLKKRLSMDVIRCTKADNQIKRCAITTGSGGDLIPKIEADCFLSGDFKYHQALEAKENGLSLIDIGHYESEAFFSGCLYEHLKNLPLNVIISNSNNPFEYK